MSFPLFFFIRTFVKAKDQMAWVGAMNNIRHSAEEFVLRDFVYSMDVRK